MRIANTLASPDDLVARLGAPESRVTSSPREFLIRRRVSKLSRSQELCESTTTSDGESITTPAPVVRVPSVQDFPGKIKVLQLWNGILEETRDDRFTALVTDRSNAAAPAERVELDVSEVSSNDRSLLSKGATFYWSIAYRDAPTGQRERVSSLRFARQARISDEQVARIFDRADRVAALLESD